MRLQRNFRKNLEIDKIQKYVNFNFWKKKKKEKDTTQKKKKLSFLTDEKYSVHNGNIYQCAKSCRQENKNGVFVPHLW